MEFRKFQIERFVEEVKAVARMTGIISSPESGKLIEEDEYLSALTDEVEEYIIDLTAARRSIILYFNRQIEKGNGLLYSEMKESFLKTNNWVRNIEIHTTGKSMFDETLINPDTDKPNLTEEEISDSVQYYPPGFTAFTGAQQQEIETMMVKLENTEPLQPENENYTGFEKDPHVKLEKDTEEDWEQYFQEKETHCKINDIAPMFASNLPLYNHQIFTLIDVIINDKDTDMINEKFVSVIAEFSDQIEDQDEIAYMEPRVLALKLATNMFNSFDSDFELNIDLDITYSDRTAMSIKTTVNGNEIVYRPANGKETIQFIFITMGALRPLTDNQLDCIAIFLEANIEQVSSIEYILDIMSNMSKLYLYSNFTETCLRISKVVDTTKELIKEQKK